MELSWLWIRVQFSPSWLSDSACPVLADVFLLNHALQYYFHRSSDCFSLAGIREHCYNSGWQRLLYQAINYTSSKVKNTFTSKCMAAMDVHVQLLQSTKAATQLMADLCCCFTHITVSSSGWPQACCSVRSGENSNKGQPYASCSCILRAYAAGISCTVEHSQQQGDRIAWGLFWADTYTNFFADYQSGPWHAWNCTWRTDRKVQLSWHIHEGRGDSGQSWHGGHICLLLDRQPNDWKGILLKNSWYNTTETGSCRKAGHRKTLKGKTVRS